MVWKKESARRTGEDWRESDLEEERKEREREGERERERRSTGKEEAADGTERCLRSEMKWE